MEIFQFGMFFVIFVTMRAIILLILLSPLHTKAQTYFENHFGGTVGLVINLGTHVNSVGVNLKGYYTDYFFQVNAGSTINLSLTNYGKRKKFWETRNVLGLILLADENQNEIDYQLDGLSHQTTHNYGVGFNYVLYNDNKGTSQQSGGFSAHINKISIYHENDVFGGQAKDRFRTGHILFTYREQDFKIGAGLNLWTGETANSNWQRISGDKIPNGYRCLEDLPYGKTSHGILYGSFTYNLGYGQYVNAKLGIDSEHIRHAFQNRLMHDLTFLPKKVERTTPHYPRLDENGCAIFTKEQARKNLLYLQIGANDNWSY